MKTLNRICSHVSASLAAARLPCFLVCEWQTEGRAGSPDARAGCVHQQLHHHHLTLLPSSVAAAQQEQEKGRRGRMGDGMHGACNQGLWSVTRLAREPCASEKQGSRRRTITGS